MFIEEADYMGVTVTCTEERWTGKVEASHPNMRGKEDLVRRAITDPDVVMQEYEYGPEPTRGRLVTAFMRRRRRRGDVLLYARGGTP